MQDKKPRYTRSIVVCRDLKPLALLVRKRLRAQYFPNNFVSQLRGIFPTSALFSICNVTLVAATNKQPNYAVALETLVRACEARS